MLSMNNEKDIEKMFKYYRTSDMLSLLIYFPEISPIKNLTIVESIEDYLNNKDYIETFDSNRVDTLKGKKILEIENRGCKEDFYETMVKIKETDPDGVLVLFNVDTINSNRYERYAGISVGVEVGTCVYIDAVSKGFDGREVSKGICSHERYMIPWFELRGLCLNNFKNYRTFLIDNDGYLETRNERCTFLKSVGYNEKDFEKVIPVVYEEIPDFIWQNVIEKLLKKLYRKEDELIMSGYKTFAISGHTEGKKYAPWQMFDNGRYDIKKSN